MTTLWDKNSPTKLFPFAVCEQKKILDKPPIFPQTGEKQMTSSLRNTFT